MGAPGRVPDLFATLQGSSLKACAGISTSTNSVGRSNSIFTTGPPKPIWVTTPAGRLRRRFLRAIKTMSWGRTKAPSPVRPWNRL